MMRSIAASRGRYERIARPSPRCSRTIPLSCVGRPAALLLEPSLVISCSGDDSRASNCAGGGGWNLDISRAPRPAARARRLEGPRRALALHGSAGFRSPRWFATAERILEEQRAIDEADEGEPIQRRLRDRTASLVGSHPVIVASFLAVLVGAVAVRELIGAGSLAGGALPAFPDQVGSLFAELASAVRSTPLGGPLAPSPAVGALGALSVATLGDPHLAQKASDRRAAPRRDLDVPSRGSPVGPSGTGLLPPLVRALFPPRSGRSPRAGWDCLIALAVLPAATERVEAAFALARSRLAADRASSQESAVTFAVGSASFRGSCSRSRSSS